MGTATATQGDRASQNPIRDQIPFLPGNGSDDERTMKLFFYRYQTRSFFEGTAEELSRFAYGKEHSAETRSESVAKVMKFLKDQRSDAIMKAEEAVLQIKGWNLEIDRAEALDIESATTEPAFECRP